MRVLTITNLYPPDVIGGYELACKQMVEALRERGHEVMVLTSRARRWVPAEEGVQRSLRLTDWHTRLHRQPATPELERVMDVQGNVVDPGNVGALVGCLDTFAPDVVYLWNTGFIGGLGIVGALAQMQVPVVWHLMDAAPNASVSVAGRSSSAAARLVSHRLRAKYLLCSQRLREEIAACGFEFGEHAELVPNWVAPIPGERERSWYPETPQLRIVTAGQLAPHKGVDMIIEVARRLLDAGRAGFCVDLFGGGLDDRYRRQILERGLEDHVRLRGPLDRDELIQRYWDYDVFLFPTWSREPFGFAPLEAAACGCVPVINRDCGIAEWCVDGVDVIKVATDARELTAVVAGILDGAVALAPLGRRARGVIARSFSIDTAVDQVERSFHAIRRLAPVRSGDPGQAYNLARLAERLALDWAQSPGRA